MLLSSDELIQELDSIRKGRSSDPFVATIMPIGLPRLIQEHRLTREQVTEYAKAEFFLAEQYPGLLASIRSRCPHADLKRQFEVEAEARRRRVELVLSFADACGVDRRQWNDAIPQPGIDTLLDARSKVAESGGWLEAVTFICFSTEKAEAEWFPGVHRALRDHYRFERTDFWDLERVGRGDLGEQALRACATTPESQDQAREAARMALRLQYVFEHGVVGDELLA